MPAAVREALSVSGSELSGAHSGPTLQALLAEICLCPTEAFAGEP